MRVVNVNLGERSYDIYIGTNLYKKCLEFLAGKKYSKKALVITDENVDRLYGASFMEDLSNSGFSFAKVVTVVGEEAKSLQWAEKIYTKAIDEQLDRKSPFFAFGGGVPGDLAGFAAATYMRGVPFIQVPTTLLAQVDSSVGGKVAVNHPKGKNMIGAFHQPDAVFADLNVLQTLSERDYASGLAEIVKYACLDGEDLLVYLERNVVKIKARDNEVLAELIALCCEYKAKIVAEDEREGSKRMYLNLGHTYGHAVETAGNFSKYSHGEAVAIGLHGALLLSQEVYSLNEYLVKRVLKLLKDFSLPVFAEGIDLEQVYAALWHDKKAMGGNLQWVLMAKAGDIHVRNDIKIDFVKKVLQKILL